MYSMYSVLRYSSLTKAATMFAYSTVAIPAVTATKYFRQSVPGMGLLECLLLTAVGFFVRI